MHPLAQRLLALQEQIRAAVRDAQTRHQSAELSQVDRVGDDDTIFTIDVHAERVLLAHCEAWGREEPLRLCAEGLPQEGVVFGRGEPRWRLLVDPIDGTRPLMHDKRSAWSLAAIAPERGEATRLADVVVASMTELPPSWQTSHARLWSVRGGGSHGDRTHAGGHPNPIAVQPSPAKSLRFGFVASCNFFLGAKDLIARIEEEILRRHLDLPEPWRAEVYTDLYMSSGAQIAELALGRDRFALDVRPRAHAKLGQARALCSHPYDLCTALIAQEAGCIITDLDGATFDAAMQTTGDVGWIGYANAELAQRLQPLVEAVLRQFLN
ncbi:MAG: inositol monophosphatase family protein [Planctomycetota bacterium]